MIKEFTIQLHGVGGVTTQSISSERRNARKRALKQQLTHHLLMQPAGVLTSRSRQISGEGIRSSSEDGYLLHAQSGVTVGDPSSLLIGQRVEHTVMRVHGRQAILGQLICHYRN